MEYPWCGFFSTGAYSKFHKAFHDPASNLQVPLKMFKGSFKVSGGPLRAPLRDL